MRRLILLSISVDIVGEITSVKSLLLLLFVFFRFLFFCNLLDFDSVDW